ncbi:hypothetical protein HNQ77_005175 [Silvibacterium bohemicum]|uniref:Uncharacterized protein n=1 Tax=Silvibacterium bohemicum TaxID=1577686 RepID=A0A841K7V4_9BACT|nr:hypothetical protein [Silvibacterium bohemicum]MBB6147181.1 hypothetical protein [Silvibacterium bohemicum]
MNVRVTFANPFYILLYSAVLLTLGWSIGAEWGHSRTAGWWLLAATLLMLIHDTAMTITIFLISIAFAQRNKATGEQK